MPIDFIARAKREGSPVVDGERATFVWRGPTAPQLLGDFTWWEHNPPIEFEPIGPRVWARTLTFPRDAYLEYVLVRRGERVEDPLNPRRVFDGVGGYNHFFEMPAAQHTALINPVKGLPRGQVAAHMLHSDLIAGGKRRVYMYQPPATEPCPLLVVFDGSDYLKRAHLTHIVDNLIGQHRLRPIAMALLDHGGPARIAEFSTSDAVLGFIAAHVLPLAQRELNLTPPGHWGLLGASLGGLMSLYTAYRMPEVFDRVISQSGAFTVRGYDSIIFDMVRSRYHPELKIWMDAGRYEYLIDSNRRMAAALQEQGYDVAYREYSGGHNYTAWRDDVVDGLIALWG
jgi:enterochelin esterase family protein